ncbi:MAG: class I SAM-dependent methyltransferase [Zoogloeaceae bacterium]|nr:class I SAM-dependent methyltransferase [Rhodocyclaceae bacterium]MCP5237942.1 class I SAM-dependent methyltransferase [Zoogloeaceae bacterium]
MSRRPTDRTRFLRAIRTGELRFALAALRPGDRRILEIGGGQGWQARQLERRGYQVCSIDVARHPDACDDSPVMLYDGHRIPFADDCFDVVFSSNVLEHVAHLDAFEHELHRVLRPGGLAIHVLPTPAWRLWTSLTHPVRVVRAAVARLGGAGVSDAGVAHSAGSLRYVFWPNRHGERGNSLSELYWFSQRAWQRHFDGAGWQVLAVRACPYFYTGQSVFGPIVTLRLRRVLAAVLGAATRVFVLAAAETNESMERSG